MVERNSRFSGWSSSSRTRTGTSCTASATVPAGLISSMSDISPYDAQMHPDAAGVSALTDLFVCALSIFMCGGRFISGFSGQATKQFWQSLEDPRPPQPLPVVDCRVTADDFARGHIVGNARLRSRDDTVTDP